MACRQSPRRLWTGPVRLTCFLSCRPPLTASFLPADDSFFVAHLYALDEPLRKAVLSQIRSIVTSSKVCRHAALATVRLFRCSPAQGHPD